MNTSRSLVRSFARSLCGALLIVGASATARASLAQSADLRWAGHVADVTVRKTSQDAVEAWTVEDGGRIRYRDPSTGVWDFQGVPDDVLDTLHRSFFLDNDLGWAVGAGGWVLKTTNGGTTWSVQTRIATPLDLNDPDNDGADPWEELYDIHFVNADDGWMIGIHSIWVTTDGGVIWDDLPQFVPGNATTTQGGDYDLHTEFFHLYGLDVVERPDGSRLGLIVGQPGIVLRSVSSPTNPDLTAWEVIWDVGMHCPTSGNTCSNVSSVLDGCACRLLCTTPGPIPATEAHSGPWMEIWDVEISRHATQPLALFVGGVGFQCGMIYSSTNDGASWSKNQHECCVGGPPCVAWCQVDPAYNPDPQNPNHLYRLKHLRMQYGMHLFSSDNSAVSVAYNGQILVRNPTSGLWQDRSEFAAGLPTVSGSVTFPLTGAAGVELTSGTKVAVIGGMGGLLRESFDGGQTWTTIGEQAPHRIADVSFLDDSIGWHVGQFYRISESTDGAVSFTEQPPFTMGGTSDFQAVVSETGPNKGAVAVGNPYVVDPVTSSNTQPRIRYTSNTLQPNWSDASIPGASSFTDHLKGKALFDVTWNGAEFWAVGQGGLILKSADDGATWDVVLPETVGTIGDFEMEGVAFRNTTTGLIVGRRPVSSVLQGVVYQYTSTSWNALSLPAGVEISGLYGVAIDASSGDAWVVGQKVVNEQPEGILLTATWSGSGYSAFSAVAPFGGFPLCLTGDGFDGIPVLNAVAVGPVSGDVWVGGLCGRLWVRDASGSWAQVKSQTDAHVLGMSFVNTGGSESGYLGCFRSGPTQQSIVRVQ